MAIPEKYKTELISRSDIVEVVSSYVRLEKKSRNHFGLCPFHSEKTPSFSVNAERQSFKCFGCGKGGDVISFIMEIEHLGFMDAVDLLADRANMPRLPRDARDEEESSKRKRILELNRDAARWFYEQLCGETGRPCRDYAAARGLSPGIIKTFGLGYAPDSWNSLLRAMKQKGYTEQELLDAALIKPGRSGGAYDTFRNRLMFPVIDVRGSVIGFSGRIIGDGEPKYLNSPETLVFKKSQNLFAMNLAKKSKSGHIILTEGNLDVVSLHQAGFDSAVASLGTSLTPEQARLISRYVPEVLLCYDGDSAGRKATDRAIGILNKLELKVRVLELPGAKDPDEFIKKNGSDAFRNILEGSAGQLDYRLRLIEEQYPPDADSTRMDYLKKTVALLARLPSVVERELYAVRTAQRLGVSQEAVIKDVERVRKSLIKGVKNKEQKDGASVNASDWKRPYAITRQSRAEEGLLLLLHLDPGLLSRTDLPRPEDFSVELLGRFYRRILEQGSFSLSEMAEEFSPDEMFVLVCITEMETDMSRASEALRDYIKIIAPPAAGEDDLRRYAEKLRENKGYGG